MIMVFDEVDLIIGYGYGKVKPAEFVQVCPLEDNYELVSVWIGKDPKHPPFEGAPVDEAASMTIAEFADLMLGDPDEACFDLIANAVP